MGLLDGKIALITGAANGMGHTITETFAKEGAFVFACDILDEVKETWSNNSNVEPHVLDVTSTEAVNELVELIVAKHGNVDILCNVAGINDLCYPLIDTSDEMWHRVVNIDLFGPFILSRAAVKAMLAKGGGVILNISSLAQYGGNHGASYASAKHGLRGLTMHVASHYADKGIRCNAIAPGTTLTNIEERSGGKYHEEGIQRTIDCLSRVDVGLQTTQNIADVALFLCSDAASRINGAIVPVDGGTSAM